MKKTKASPVFTCPFCGGILKLISKSIKHLPENDMGEYTGVTFSAKCDGCGKIIRRKQRPG